MYDVSWSQAGRAVRYTGSTTAHVGASAGTHSRKRGVTPVILSSVSSSPTTCWTPTNKRTMAPVNVFAATQT